MATPSLTAQVATPTRAQRDSDALARAAHLAPRWRCLGCGLRAMTMTAITEHVAGCRALASSRAS